MTVNDVLRVIDEYTPICVQATMFGVEFTAKHYRNSFLDLEDTTLLSKRIERIYASDNELHLVIK